MTSLKGNHTIDHWVIGKYQEIPWGFLERKILQALQEVPEASRWRVEKALPKKISAHRGTPSLRKPRLSRCLKKPLEEMP